MSAVAREHRRLLGVLLAWAILPLPFTGITRIEFWLPAALTSVWLLALPGRVLRLGAVGQNLAALAVLGAVLAAGGMNVGPLRPLGHLVLLLAAVRVLLVADRRAMIRALPAVALLWLVSVASSTHVTLVGYLLASAVVAWWAGMEILLGGLPSAATAGRRRRPRLAHAAVAGLLACALAVPVFVAVPRLRSPFLAGAGGSRAVTGFSTAVELAGVGAIQESREVALVIAAPAGEEVKPQWTRLRATAFDLVRTGVWAPRRAGLVRADADGDVVRLAEGASLQGTTRLELDLLRPERYLFVPEGAVAVRAPVPLWLDPAGGLVIGRRGLSSLRYEVWVAEAARPRLEPPTERDLHNPRLSREVAEMAREITAGARGAEEFARRVGNHLSTEYRYSLTVQSRRFEPDPVGWFLLVGRAGHCEYFAGSMVVLLRSLGVPARMVGGYAGGSPSPSGREVLVRQGNAHTWVEVWLGPRRGWTVFDPTPAEGVPTFEEVERGDRLRALRDWVLIGWDRYVLTFGFADQLELAADAVGTAIAAGRSPLLLRSALAAVFLLAAAFAWRAAARPLIAATRERRRRPAATALRRLERRLGRVGEPLPVGITVRRIGRAASRRWPSARVPIERLVGIAETELYGPGGRGRGTPGEADRAWAEVRAAIGRE